MRPRNLLVIMSDEHNPKVMGCAGHPIVKTPNLDRLAASGTRFTSAYTASPVCIPARAAFACGKYNHQIGFWDNADAYDGSVPSWHHVLRANGRRVDSIGKLHFRLVGEDHGFTEEQIPLHIIEGKGDLVGLIRDDLPRRYCGKMAEMAGPGQSTYTVYDNDIASRAQIWLREQARKAGDQPWVLFVSLVAPHFPLTAPPEHYYRYWDQDLPMPKLYAKAERPDHPFLNDYRHSLGYDDYFDGPESVKRALAGYFGLVSFLDENIGKVLAALADSGFADNTNVLYTSDHGDNLGTRGMWGKSTMYEESAGVPLIISGPGVPEGVVVDQPVSHVDCFPTILNCSGVPFESVNDGHPGVDLIELANGAKPDRTVLSEYHAMGSTTGAFMIRHGAYKYVYYVKYAPQLFDLEADPEELRDVAEDPAYEHILQECHAALLAICDPVAVDRAAKQRQVVLLADNGGRDGVMKYSDFAFSPAPGTAAVVIS